MRGCQAIARPAAISASRRARAHTTGWFQGFPAAFCSARGAPTGGRHFAQQRAGRAQIGQDGGALRQRQAGRGARLAQAAVARQQRNQRQLVRLPPLHVGGAKGAAHHRAAALLRSTAPSARIGTPGQRTGFTANLRREAHRRVDEHSHAGRSSSAVVAIGIVVAASPLAGAS